MSRWSIATIEGIAEKIAMGPFGSNIKVSTFVDSGIPVISGQHLHKHRLTDGDYNFVTEGHAEKLKNSNVFRGDVVFTHAGSIGQVSWIPDNSRYERYVLSQRQFYLRCNRSRANPAWIAYFFRSREGQHKLLANASQTGVPSIARPASYLKTIELSLPPLDQQDEIVHILGTLDDKVELNRRMNRTLEAMAQAIFKSWFVDFEPVKAKAAAKAAGASPEEIERAAMTAIAGKTEAELDQLPQAQKQSLAKTAALFPDGFQDSELGEIPEGWKTSPVGEQCKIARGASPRPIKNFMNGSVPWVKIADATASDSAFIFETKEFVTPEGAERSVRLGPGSLILSNSATCGIPMFLELDGCIHDGWLYFREFGDVNKNYLYFTLARLTAKLVQIADGSVQKNLNTSLVSREHFVVPTPEIHAAFDSFSTSVFVTIRSNSLQSRTLAQLRDTLLPKLLSGDLPVPAAQSQIEEALA